MRFITILGILFFTISPAVTAGLVSLEIDELQHVDWDTGSTQVGGNLQLLFDDSVADSNANPELGRYQNAIKGGHFWSARDAKTYTFDIAAHNYVQVETVGDMFTGITLRGYLNDEWGNSRLFDLWMEANFKADDYLHNLKSQVNVWENSVIFNLFEPANHFEGITPRNVVFNTVPAPASGLLLLTGLLALALRFLTVPLRSLV